jgi:uncharacterized membrane protein
MAQPAKSDMSTKPNEHFIELFIGNLLRVCVLLTVAIVVLGAALLLPGSYLTIPSYAKFLSEPAYLRSVPSIVAAAFHGDAKAIVQAGMLLLILTPILRVAFSVAAFFYEKDYLYVALTIVVLGLLMFSLAGG